MLVSVVTRMLRLICESNIATNTNVAKTATNILANVSFFIGSGVVLFPCRFNDFQIVQSSFFSHILIYLGYKLID